MAFSLTYLNGAAPSIENLNLLESREFSKRTSSKPTIETFNVATGVTLPIYGEAGSAQYPFERFKNPRVV